MQYLVIIEKRPESYGAYVPDLPGCIAAGETRDEVLRQIRQAIETRLETLRNSNRPIPAPSSTVEMIRVEAPAK